MRLKKFYAMAMATILSLSVLAGCSSETKKTETGSSGAGSNGTKEIKLAHNLNEDHSVHVAMVEFSRLVEEKTGGSVKVSIYPNGQLGSETEVLEQLQAGGVGMTKVSASSLTTYYEGYNAFTLPYVFDDAEHFEKCMDSDAVKELYQTSKEKGFIGLTYYTSGARNFYTKGKAITKPEDLKGLKIRVMDTPTQLEMVEAMGGTPVGLPYGDVYTSLQSGVIDGTENNETALTNGKHGEVCKYYSFDEHTRIPDILVISSKVWDTLSDKEQEAVQEAAVESTEYHLPIWNEAIEEAIEESKETMQVTFNKVDKAPFREATKSVREKYAEESTEIKKLLDAFEALR